MIVHDLQAVQSAAHGERGIARFVAELAKALAVGHTDVVDVFTFNDRLPWSPRLDEFRRLVGDRLQPASALRGRRVDVLHVTSPFEPLPLTAFRVPVVADRLVVTCYDLIPYVMRSRYLADPATRAFYTGRLGLLCAADHVVTDSRSAADDVVGLLGVDPDRVTPVGAGVDGRFVPPDTPLDDRIRHLAGVVPGLRAGFVLMPSGMDWRKNVDGAISAYGRLPEEVRARHQLVVSGRIDAEERDRLGALAARTGARREVLFTDFLDDDDLVRLYQSAELVFFPSFYEGFGLPVLEARRCGARVICSGLSSLPEVLPHPAAWFNPYDQDEMAEVLQRSLTDPSFARLLADVPDAGFTWDRAAADVAEVYAGLRVAAPSRRPRPRVAVVTVLPPVLGGVADHSGHLLRAMSTMADVTAFVPDEAAQDVDVWPFPVESLRTLFLRVEAGEFDHVVYCIGNNEHHARFLPLLEQVPGHLLLHDVRLSGCASIASARHGWRRDDDDPPDVDETGFDRSLAVRSVVRRGRLVMVHSRHAVQLIADAAGVDAIDVGPLPYPPVGLVAPEPPERPPLVVSAGIADPKKGTDRFVDAMQLLTRRRPDVAAAIVGPGGERYAPAAVREGRPEPGRLVATGDVNDEEFDAWLHRADVAVQLRLVSNGESSGVVAQLLPRGVPTIVTDLGAMAELPDDVVVHVPVDVTAEELAATVERLLDDVDRRRLLRGRALAHVAENGYEVEARRVLAALAASGTPYTR